MELIMLGTGNAMVTRCYNTCFVLRSGEQHLLVDGGGGNTLLRRLQEAHIDWRDLRTIFVTHKHIDHILGIAWMMRLICQNMAQGTYEGEATIYAHSQVIDLLRTLARGLLQENHLRFLDKGLHLVAVEDRESRELIGRSTTFFDIGSTKDRQFGFSMDLGSGKKLTCCGDEPYHDCEESYVRGSSTRPSACTVRLMYSIPMKSTTPPWPMPAAWPENWGWRIWCSIIPRTKISPGARSSTPGRAANTSPAGSISPMTWSASNSKNGGADP